MKDRDKTTAQRAAPGESALHAWQELETPLAPESTMSALELADIIDSEELQQLMDEFYRLTHIGIGILDLHGRVLVGTGWQDICTQFHRVHAESCRLCRESDLELSRNIPAGAFKQYRCKNNMWEIATPIMLGEKHVGNIFLGQFLFENETPDYETFRQQARRYGFDEQAYLAALDRVPRWSHETVNAAMSFYATLAGIIGNLSYSNVKFASVLEERKRAEDRLRQSERYKTIQNQIANIFLTIPDEEMYGQVLAIVLQVLESKFGVFGFIGESGDLVVPSMTRGIWNECQVSDKSIVFPQNTWGKSLWGRAIREKRALYSDGPFHTPEGHVPVDHFLTAPVVFGNETIGLISVANNERGYTQEDKQLLEAITDYISPILNARLQRDRQEQERKRAERELQHSNELLRAIIEAAPTAIIGLDLEGRVHTVWNPAAEKMLGWSAQEIMGQFLPSVSVDKVEEFRRFREWIRSGKTLDGVEVRRRRRDGSPIDYSIYASPLHDAEGQISGNVAVLVDTTDRKRAEEELRISEGRYRMAQAMGHVGNWEYNLQTTEFWGSDEAKRIYGFDPQQSNFSTDEVENCIPERERVHQALVDLIEKGKPYNLEFEIHPHDSTRPRIIASIAELKRDDHGNPLKVVGVIQDITERKQAEKERESLTAQIREQARELQQILATVPEGVLLLDTAGKLVQANPVAEKDLVVLAGVSVGDVITRLGDRSLAELLTSPLTKGLWHEIKADQRIFEAIARPMGNASTLEYWVLVINEVTQARGIRAQLQQQERMAAVGQLAAGIAHDFNNIMAVITLYAQMTARLEGLPAHVQERMTIIHQQAQHATRLIQQILDFSRKSVLERHPLDLLPLLKEQCKLLERTLPENIEISLEHQPAEYIVNAALTRIQQVIMNLAVNARDAMPKGGKLHIALSRTTRADEIRCVTCGEVSGGEWGRITVTDAGSGIPPDVLPYIFEPFFTTKAPGQGTGLGLSQVYGIVKQHEGHIDVTTKVREGTTFSVYLPILPASQPELPTQENPTLIQGRAETLLIVEDNAPLRKALVDTLESLNYQVREAVNGQEALAILQQSASEIALVVSDLVMPEMGGQALFHAMRQRGLTLPLILLSGHPMEKELQNLQAQGVVGWMSKPPDMEQLSRMLARVLRGKT